jgi:hypothetical protein
VSGQTLTIAHEEQRQRKDDERRQEHNTHEWAGKQGRQSLHLGSVSRSLGCKPAKTKGNKRFATEIGPTVLALAPNDACVVNVLVSRGFSLWKPPTSMSVFPTAALQRGWIDSRSLWAHRDFLRLFTAQSVSLFGSEISVIALPLTAVLLLGAGPA